MSSAVHSNHEESAGSCGWRSLYQTALLFFRRGEHAVAKDILRMLILAVPWELEMWDALAECHDAESQPDVGEALRSLGRTVTTQLEMEARQS
jgi:hypothetical protein